MRNAAQLTLKIGGFSEIAEIEINVVSVKKFEQLVRFIKYFSFFRCPSGSSLLHIFPLFLNYFPKKIIKENNLGRDTKTQMHI